VKNKTKGILMRKFGFLVAVPVVGALLGVAPAAAQPTPEVTAFCDAALRADRAADKVFASEKPKQKDIQAFDSALAGAESTAPPEVATNVQTVASEIRSALQRREEPSEEVLEPNLNAIDQYRYNSCGYRQLAVTGIEYEFQGLPRTLPTGTVAIQFNNPGAELHELAIYRIKSKDSLKKIVGLSEKERRKKLEEIDGTFAMQNQTTYVIAELSKPGRYGVVCHLPVGSTSEEALEEAEKKKDHPKSHADEGMYATIKVEKA
jgi:hypothetical protein